MAALPPADAGSSAVAMETSQQSALHPPAAQGGQSEGGDQLCAERTRQANPCAGLRHAWVRGCFPLSLPLRRDLGQATSPLQDTQVLRDEVSHTGQGLSLCHVGVPATAGPLSGRAWGHRLGCRIGCSLTKTVLLTPSGPAFRRQENPLDPGTHPRG